jgi:hypothetical protein
LSQSADIRLDEGESRLAGNNLWAVVLDALSAHTKEKGREEVASDDEGDLGADLPSPSAPFVQDEDGHEKRRRRSFIRRLFGSPNRQ